MAILRQLVLTLVISAILFCGCSGMGEDDDDDSSHSPTPVDITPTPVGDTPTPTSTPAPTIAPTPTPLPLEDGTATLEIRNDRKIMEDGFVMVYGDVLANDDSDLTLCAWMGTWLDGSPVNVFLACDSNIDYPLPIGEWVAFILDTRMKPSNYGVRPSDVFYTFCVLSEDKELSTC